MAGEIKHSYLFKSFRLNVSERRLLRDNSPVSLTPKAFDVLAMLVEQNGHLVEKDELLKHVWADSFVEEANIARIIHTLRRTLGEDENGNKFIETVATKGYRFVAEVTEDRGTAEQPANKLENLPAVEVDFPDTIDIDEDVKTDAQIPLVTLPVESKPRTRVVLFSVGFLTAVSLILLLSFNFRFGSAPASGAVKSIAVLPLKPLAAENRDLGYELGIADSLIFKLGSAKGIIVRTLNATSQYADAGQDPIAAGREQKVDYVLASNYQIADGKIRITSQLINVQSGQVEGTFKVDQANTAIFTVQDAVAANIGEPLLKKLNRQSSDPAEKRYTPNEEAYRLYLQGAALSGSKRNAEKIRKAIGFFEQAIAIDPNFALAYAELGSAHNFFAFKGEGRDATDGYIKGKAALEKALAIDETLAEAHSHLGVLKSNYEWDFAGSEREHKRAVELDPNSSAAHCFYGLLLGTIGKSDEAIAEMKTAIDLDPADAGTRHSYGWVLFQSRRYDEAIAEELRVIEMDPTLIMANNVLMNSYDQKGDDDKYFEYYVRLQTLRGKDPDEINLLQTIYAQSGRRGVSQRHFEQAKEDERNGKPKYDRLANLSMEFGQNEEAITYLEKAVDENKFTLITLKVNPRYDQLRSNPRFDALMARIGLK